MVLSLADAVAIFNKWKEDSAEVLVVTESPFQQSRRGVLEQSIDWGLGPVRQRVGGLNRDQHERKGKKAGTVVLEAPAGNLSLSIGLCTFVYEEPKEAKSVVRAEAESTTVSAPSVFFPSNEVFVFYELREPPGKESLPGSSRD